MSKEKTMKNLFSLDNPAIQFLARVGDLILVNFLFLICCIPVITIGPALAGLTKMTQDIACEEEKGVFRTFFRAFGQNFKQATLGWLAILLFLSGLGCYFLLVKGFLEGALATALCWVLAILAALVLAIASYLFPLMVRYENTLKEHVFNSGILALIKLPRTIGLMLLNLLPLLLLALSPQGFLQTLVFWLFIGFGFCSYLCSILLTPVFKELEDPNGTKNMKLFK